MDDRPAVRRRRRSVGPVVIGGAAIVVLLVVGLASAPRDDDERPSVSTTTSSPRPATGEELAGSISMGVEAMAGGGVRFHLPVCAADGVTNIFWHVVLRDRSADLESWNADADVPHHVRSVVGGVAPDGFLTTEPLEAVSAEMRDDVFSIAAAFRSAGRQTVGIRFRLADLRVGQIAYRSEPTGRLRFAASADELDAQVTCSS